MLMLCLPVLNQPTKQRIQLGHISDLQESKDSLKPYLIQGRIQDFWKGVHMYMYKGVGFALLILSHFS